MEDWDVVLLGDIVKINMYTYSPKENWNFINYLDTGNITKNEINEIQYIAMGDKVPSRARRKVHYNSIIYSTVRPIQQHYGIIKKIPNNFLVSTGFAVIDVDSEKADADYIYFVLSQRKIVEYLQTIAEQSTSAYPSIKPSDLELIEIPLPSIEIQRKISSILCSINLKMEINKKINDNLAEQIHQLFVYFFKHNSANIVLGDVIETTSGGTPSRKHTEYYENGTICWVKSKELLGSYIHNTEEHINDLALLKSSVKLLPEHSVLIAMYGATVGAYGIISKPMACNQAVCALLCNEKYPYTYLVQIAKEYQQKLINMAVGSAQQNISQFLIKQLPIHNDVDVIQKFHCLAQPLHQQIEYLQAENLHLADIRDTLLPKLISGEVDVSAIDL